MDSKSFMSMLFSLTVVLATESNTVTGYEAYPDYASAASSQRNLIAQFEDRTPEECADLCNGQMPLCAGFTIFDGGRCNLRAAITLIQNRGTWNRATYVKIVASVPGVPGYKAYPDYGSSQGNLIGQFGDSTVDACAGLCNGQMPRCAGFTIFDGGLCRLKAAITLAQNGGTWNQATYVKIVAPVPGYEAYQDYSSGPGNIIAQFDDLTAEECADLCTGRGMLCAGFTIFDHGVFHGRCNLKAAISLTQNGGTFNRATYVKIVAPASPAPTPSPTDGPTTEPSPSPTFRPTDSPSDAPHMSPTEDPSFTPTDLPTPSPTDPPTDLPTPSPTPPTDMPTFQPGYMKSQSPTETPSSKPRDCQECVIDFDEAGGCELMHNGDHVRPLIPDGCMHCGETQEYWNYCEGSARWDRAGFGQCIEHWEFIGTATTLKEACGMMLKHCSSAGSMLFYKGISDSVYCATADHHEDCTGEALSWRRYVLSYID